MPGTKFYQPVKHFWLGLLILTCAWRGGERKITLGWDDMPGALYYVIYWSDSNSVYCTTSVISRTSVHLHERKVYYFAVTQVAYVQRDLFSLVEWQNKVLKDWHPPMAWEYGDDWDDLFVEEESDYSNVIVYDNRELIFL